MSNAILFDSAAAHYSLTFAAGLPASHALGQHWASPDDVRAMLKRFYDRGYSVGSMGDLSGPPRGLSAREAEAWDRGHHDGIRDARWDDGRWDTVEEDLGNEAARHLAERGSLVY